MLEYDVCSPYTVVPGGAVDGDILVLLCPADILLDIYVRGRVPLFERFVRLGYLFIVISQAFTIVEKDLLWLRCPMRSKDSPFLLFRLSS